MSQTKTKTKTKGIRCPVCKGAPRLYQARTVQRADGSIQRKRRCAKCPHQVVTFERVQSGR